MVDNQGNLDIDTSTQLRLGWQLGFRMGSYWCGGVPYNSNWSSDLGFSFTKLPSGSQEAASRETIGSAASEGITLITGPRYCFLAVNDHSVSTGPTMLVAYASQL